MAFSAAEVANIANATLDFYVRGPALSQVIQARPIYDALRRAQKTFPGGGGSVPTDGSGGGLVARNVKGVYSTQVEGYSHTDTVTYTNPANIVQASAQWKEHHAGISVTLTELKANGISIVDTTQGKESVSHSRSELIRITNLLEDKLEDMAEGWARSFTQLLLRDGSGDPQALAGLQAVVRDAPTTGTVLGIDSGTNSWWRNRALTTANGTTQITTNVAETLHKEMRQLRRYGGRPNLVIAGSDFLDALVAELRASGYYTNTGWNRPSSTDIAVADINYNGLKFQYEPALDDEGRSKFCYILDTRHLYLYTMEGEDMKPHTPARPHDQYVIYRAVTYTGCLFCDQLNAQGVYEIA